MNQYTTFSFFALLHSLLWYFMYQDLIFVFHFHDQLVPDYSQNIFAKQRGSYQFGTVVM